MVEEKKSVSTKYWTAVGRRKTAIASVKISGDDKTFAINNKKIDFSEVALAPLELVGQTGKFGVHARVSGGGKVSQQEAIRLGISRALEKFDPELKTTLKKAGFIMRDPREKERKKPGLKGARRAPQWAKR